MTERNGRKIYFFSQKKKGLVLLQQGNEEEMRMHCDKKAKVGEPLLPSVESF